MKRVIPAVLAKTDKEACALVEKLSPISQKLHFDVGDGHLVRQKSLQFRWKFHSAVLEYADVHLMVKHPVAWLARHTFQVDRIFIHADAKDVEQALLTAPFRCEHVGLALSPKTPVRVVDQFHPLIDSVLILTVKPGAYGGTYLPTMLKKVRKIRKAYPQLTIIVDGGMNPARVIAARKAGADQIISGSYVACAEKPKTAFKALVAHAK